MASSHETGLRLPAVLYTPHGVAQEIPHFKVNERDENLMQRAIDLAAIALGNGDYPVGAVLVNEWGDTFEGMADEFATNRLAGHAEQNAIAEYNRRTGKRELTGTTLYVTQSPCVGCSAQIDQGKLPMLHQAATRQMCNDASMTAYGIHVVRQRELDFYNILNDSPRAITVVTGLLQAESIGLFLEKARILKQKDPHKL